MDSNNADRQIGTFHGTAIHVKNTFICVGDSRKEEEAAKFRPKRRSAPSLYSIASSDDDEQPEREQRSWSHSTSFSANEEASQEVVAARFEEFEHYQQQQMQQQQQQQQLQQPKQKQRAQRQPNPRWYDEEEDEDEVSILPSKESGDCEMRSYGSITTCDTAGRLLATEESEEGSSEWRTTVMIRGLPEAMTRQMLEELINSEGFFGSYDFMYVPADLGSGLCFCHAFVNFVSAEEAKRFRRHFTGFTNWPTPCEKEGAVDWSEALQGLQELLDRYRNSPLMHRTVPPGLRPALYQGGFRATFPPPTVPLKAPRARRSGQKKKLAKAPESRLSSPSSPSSPSQGARTSRRSPVLCAQPPYSQTAAGHYEGAWPSSR
mmetsp:Transcript_90573/g.189436  ORF Transcript_90573/g.189436 Transcript_90573/m.189436 type:complete len:376 (+) Transcript_90573:53-1180(+)